MRNRNKEFEIGPSEKLAPLPLSVFAENGFQKNLKADLFDVFKSTNTLLSSYSTVHVIHGAFLLHKVV